MKRKKTMALMLAAVMALGGCGANDSSTTNQGGEETGTEATGNESGTGEVDLSEKYTYTIFSQADDNPDVTLDNNPVIQYWKNLYNIEVEWQLPPQGSEAEQLTTMLGTGDYTDVIDISFNQENLGTLCDDGVIYDLSGYIETYMPNYYAFLNENADVKAALYDDEGRIFNVAVVQEAPQQWGGLVYRRDILDTMTGGNISFPSGNDEPTTIEDWDYMLPLMKQYFDAAGMQESACLIIPYCGYFPTGEFMAGFGIGGLDYVDNDGKVKYGIAEDNFYNYLTKMKEWYDAGYVYSDFASRSQDLFYLPNTALTYSGATGVWFGLNAQLGDAMSLPDYGLYMDVEPLSAPADTANGIETPLGIYLDSGRASNNSGWAISTACSEEKLIRILTAFDYFFSDEGAATRTMGLSSEQGSADCEEYVSRNMANGTRLPGTTQWTDEMNKAADYNVVDFAANRMPGIVISYPTRECDYDESGVDVYAHGDEVWTRYGNENVLSLAVTLTPDETNQINLINTAMQDYANTAIVNFIMGKEELTPESFKAYQEQLKECGLEDYLAIKQVAYERYQERAN